MRKQLLFQKHPKLAAKHKSLQFYRLAYKFHVPWATVLKSGIALKRRIMDMGLTKGTEVYVRKVAPLGDPLELTVRGYELSVRKSDAELIEVQ